MARSLEAQEAEFELIEIPPDEQEWLELRRPHWNASLAGCLVPDEHSKTGCKHPYVTLGDALTEKLRDDFEVVDEDRARLFKRGLDMEPHIAAMVGEMTGLVLSRPTHMARRGPVLCTPDYYGVRRSSEEQIGVEIKSTRQYLGPVIPDYWRLQCQLQMWCMDWGEVVLGALDSTLDVTLYEIPRDDDVINSLVSKAQFYLDCLSLGEIPPGVTLSAGNVSTLWPRDTGATVELPAETLSALNDYLIARAEEKEARLRKEAARDEVVTLLGGDSIAAIEGVEVATFKAAKDREVFDYKRLARERPDWAAEYTDTKPGVRSFHIKERGVTGLINMLGGVSDESDIDW